MQHAQTWLHAHLHVPSKYTLSLIPVDSGCTVTNIDHGSIIHADHRMSASRPICVASKDSDAIYPDYEGYGQIMTFSNFGQIKNIRLGRCVRAPTVKDLLSVSALAEKGHNCILNQNNPRMVCKDGTIVPIYYFNRLFYMPYITPNGECAASGGEAHLPRYTVSESHLLSSINSANNLENEDPEEAVVRLDARPAPQNKIVIDTEMSDKTVALNENDRNRITHCLLGHVSHKKMAATSAVVVEIPVPTWH